MASAAAIITAVAAVGSAVQARKARKQQRKAEKIQSKRAALENARQRRQQVVQARRARAAAIAQAEGQGIGGGSQISGVTGSIGSQSASNISFLRQLEGFDQARFGALSRARDFQSNAATFQAVSSVSSNFADFGKLGRQISGVFSDNKTSN